MPIAHAFPYHKPRTLDEALDRLAEPGARILAGGTDLVMWLREGLATPASLVDIKGLPGMDAVTLDQGLLRIGPLVTFSDLLKSAIVTSRFPILAEMAAVVASLGVRNRATVVGNLCAAVACCDSGPALLALDAQVLAASPQGVRKIPLAQWFTGNRRTALQPGELVTGLEVPDPGRHGGCFIKLGRYRGQDLAQVSVAVIATPDSWRVAFGSVAASPFRSARVEAVLASGPLDPVLLAEAATVAKAEVSPITDLRATREYRTHMVGVMLERAAEAASGRRAGTGPAYGVDLI